MSMSTLFLYLCYLFLFFSGAQIIIAIIAWIIPWSFMDRMSGKAPEEGEVQSVFTSGISCLLMAALFYGVSRL